MAGHDAGGVDAFAGDGAPALDGVDADDVDVADLLAGLVNPDEIDDASLLDGIEAVADAGDAAGADALGASAEAAEAAALDAIGDSFLEEVLASVRPHAAGRGRVRGRRAPPSPQRAASEPPKKSGRGGWRWGVRGGKREQERASLGMTGERMIPCKSNGGVTTNHVSHHRVSTEYCGALVCTVFIVRC